jgi:hypothetical protein
MSKTIHIEKFQLCPGKENSTVQLADDFFFTVTNNILYMSGHVQVKESLDRSLEANIDLKHCMDSDKRCRYFNRMTIKRICSDMKLAKGVYRVLATMVDPTPSCPIKSVLCMLD